MTRFARVLLPLIAVFLLLLSCTGPVDSTQLYVDGEQCIGCGKCEDVCPYNAIEVIDNVAVIDPQKCTFCLRCVEECPQGAIY